MRICFERRVEFLPRLPHLRGTFKSRKGRDNLEQVFFLSVYAGLCAFQKDVQTRRRAKGEARLQGRVRELGFLNREQNPLCFTRIANGNRECLRMMWERMQTKNRARDYTQST